jgi:hypothetical protein
LKALCVLVVSVLLIGACGSKKKVDPAADLALAKSSVLTAADLPGYTGAAHTADDDLPAAINKSFATCLKASATIFDVPPGVQRADSEDFSKGESQLSGTTKIYPKIADIDDRWAKISQANAGPCLEQLFVAGANEGNDSGQPATVSKTSVARFDVGVGDRSVGYTVKFTLASGGRSAAFFADVVFAQRDRAGADFEFVNVGAGPDHAFEKGLVQKVYDRIGTKAS